jgi:hypothetical protein
MNGFSLLVVAALGVVYSWRTGLDQQQEYVLQIEPEVVQALAAGEEIFSELPTDAGSFQRLCIMVLAKDSGPIKHTAAAEQYFRQLHAGAGRYASLDRGLVPADPPPTLLWPGKSGANPEQTYGVNVGWQPDKNGSQQYLVQIDPTVLSTLSLGDELYVPIDPAAGRIVRFIVKAGRDNLPRTGGTQTVTSPPTTAPNLPPVSISRNRNSGWSSDSGNSWTGGNPPSDPSRSPGRLNNTVSDTQYTDPRSSQYGAPPVTLPAPDPGRYGGAYPNYSQVPPQQPNNFDSYRTASDRLAPSGYPIQPPANQQPQLPPAQRPFNQQYPETRVAGLPPTTLTAGTPQVTNPALVTPGFVTPGVAVQTQADKPWGPLLFVTFALFFSIGGNLYLAYTALEFHSRYRNAIERLRSAARSA